MKKKSTSAKQGKRRTLSVIVGEGLDEGEYDVTVVSSIETPRMGKAMAMRAARIIKRALEVERYQVGKILDENDPGPSHDTRPDYVAPDYEAITQVWLVLSGDEPRVCFVAESKEDAIAIRKATFCGHEPACDAEWTLENESDKGCEMRVTVPFVLGHHVGATYRFVIQREEILTQP